MTAECSGVVEVVERREVVVVADGRLVEPMASIFNEVEAAPRAVLGSASHTKRRPIVPPAEIIEI